MTINTKLSVGDTCYVVRDNAICSATVEEISIYVYKNCSKGYLCNIVEDYKITFKGKKEGIWGEFLFRSIDEALNYLKEHIQ